jgi:hypothetical protein
VPKIRKMPKMSKVPKIKKPERMRFDSIPEG